jgi:hypothetical protein
MAVMQEAIEDFVRAVKEIVEILGTMLIAAHRVLMVDSKVHASLRCTFLVSKEDNLDVRVQQSSFSAHLRWITLLWPLN